MATGDFGNLPFHRSGRRRVGWLRPGQKQAAQREWSRPRVVGREPRRAQRDLAAGRELQFDRLPALSRSAKLHFRALCAPVGFRGPQTLVRELQAEGR